MQSLHKHLLINVSITTQRKKTKTTKQNKKQTSKQNKTNKQNYKNSSRQTELYINKKRRDSHQIFVHYQAIPSKLVNPDSQ